MKQFILTCALTIITFLGLQAQHLIKTSYSTYIRTAEEQLELKQFYNALDNYILAYAERKDYNLAIKIGDLSYKLRDYEKAVSYYKRAIRTKEGKGTSTEYLFSYGRSQKMMGMFDEAITTLQRYIDEGSDKTLKELAKAEIQGAEFAKIAESVKNLTITKSKAYASNKTSSGQGAVKELVGPNGKYNAKHIVVGELFGNEVIFFVSDMAGGEGRDDLYYATRKSGEIYGEPVNLGPKINTIGDEATPYYRNGNLYFSSNGHPTLGGFDIFITVWDGARWSSPENLGKDYNSSLDEKYFTLDSEGYQGTLISNRECTHSSKSKTCCDDIYYFNLKKILADLIVTSFDGDTKQPLTGVSLRLIEMTYNIESITQIQTNADGNEFKFDLDLGKTYKIIAKAKNYKSTEIEFNTIGMIDSRTFEEMVNLEPLPTP